MFFLPGKIWNFQGIPFLKRENQRVLWNFIDTQGNFLEFFF